uniref:Uncharacterized protein n=1 Tax=Branchiostoma floridae TaxID=7739 RepID=C3ZL02_BRAFL|eukprot:XP_002590673.1 hypothetical protein BRAFLDRAFT_89474 [Branchiostoma floridae]
MVNHRRKLQKTLGFGFRNFLLPPAAILDSLFDNGVPSGHDHLHENYTQHGQTEQDQSQADIRNKVLAALKPNSLHDQTKQGQSQASTKSDTNKTATIHAVTSGHDHQYKDVNTHHVQGKSQADTHNKVLAALNPNPMYPCEVAPPNHPKSTIGHDQTEQGQSQAITKINSNTTAGVMTSGDDHQYEDVDKHHDQTGQGQSQAITESLDTRNESYGAGPTVSQPNPLYKFGSSESQPGSLYKFEDQHQADTNPLDNVPPRLSTPREDDIYVKPDDALSTRPASLYEMTPNNICDNDMLYCQPPANT